MSKSIFNKQSIILFFVLGLAVIASVTILTYMNIKDQQSDHEFIQDTYVRNALLDNIYSNITEAETSRRGYFLSSDPQFVASIRENRLLTDSLLKALRNRSFVSNTLLAYCDTLRPLVQQRFDIISESIEILDAKGSNAKFHKNTYDKAKILQSDIKNTISKMKREEQLSLVRQREKADMSLDFTLYILMGGILISGLIFIGLFALLLKRSGQSFESENQEITREELEQIVKERTAEISQINHKLYSKVNELEIMENALKQSEEHYRKLFEQMHDAIVIFSPDDEKVVDVNRRACDLYGLKREEFIGLSMRSISKNIPQNTENIKTTVEKGYYHNFQSVHYRKDSTEMLMEINASVFMFKGKPVILSINRDITDRILKVSL
ncbi:MAG: PAS domain S-box protein [Ignavibacteria bacterium]|nr:PAS domain S-box protein [Ignavibacteria bacterium]